MSLIQGTGGGLGGAGAPGGALGSFYSHLLDQSLKFDDGDAQVLKRTPASAGDRQKFTLSFWMKRGNLSSIQDPFSAGNSGTDRFEVMLTASDNLQVYMNNGGTIEHVTTTQVLRDVSAWYHIVLAFDTTQGTAANRLKVYVNGSQVTDFSTYDMSTVNFSTAVNSTSKHYISGRSYNDDRYFDGYLAEINLIDGTQLTPASFGETKDGIWTPKDTSGLTFGTNGFHLTFKDDVVSEGFNTVTYTGTGAAQSISGLGFEPNFVWLKSRSFGSGHALFDVVRGALEYIPSELTSQESTLSGSLTSFDSDGFSLGTNAGVNGNTRSYVGWCWEAGGTPTATNSAGAGATPTAGSVKIDGSNLGSALAGTIPATKLTANTTKGFSIVSYTGTGSVGTVAHGLGAVPKWILIKNLSTATWFTIYHTSLGAEKYIRLNSTVVTQDNSNVFNDTEPTSTVFTVATVNDVNASGDNYIAYCWAQISGYSHFGTWQNNNSTTGTQVTGLGFKPAWLLVKNTDNTERWFIQDNTRQPTNLAPPSGKFLVPNTSSVEGQNGADTASIDFQDDGFQIKTTNPASGEISFGTRNYIYMAFADTREAAFFKDVTTNGNHWTPTNLDYRDSVPDAPTNNFCTLNPLDSNITLSEGNLKALGVSGSTFNTKGSFNFDVSLSDGWYFEFLSINGSGNNGSVGLAESVGYLYSNGGSPALLNNAKTYNPDGSINFSTSFAGDTWGNGDIIGVAVKNGKVYYSKNGVFQASADPANETNPAHTGLTGFYAPFMYAPSSSVGGVYNFGQDSSFAGNHATSNSNADGNGHGSFAYAPPSGYLALCSQNLPDVDIIDGSEYFNTVLYTGNGHTTTNTQNITGIGFQPDWAWIKNRNGAGANSLFDVVRGAGKSLLSNSTAAESTQADSLTSFDSDGFSLGDNSESGAHVNVNNSTYVAWNWKAGGAAPAQTYAVTVSGDSGANKYRFDGNTTDAPTLNLQEGGTYTFDQSDSSNSGHPLRFSTTSNGTHGGGSEYTTGVTTTGTPGNDGAKTVITVAASAATLYYYCTQHSGMGGQVNTNSTFGSTHLDGSILSTVSANTTAGFSIVSYTGNTTAGATVAHGLSFAPEAIILKARDNARDWRVYHSSLGATKTLDLNTTVAVQGPNAAYWNNTAPTSSVFSVGNVTTVNGAEAYIAYCFHSVDGYSKVGSYVGNGSTNGTFIYTGFRPAFWLMKSGSDATHWVIYDSARETFNPVQDQLLPNEVNAEAASGRPVDFLSNGVKIRFSSYLNDSGQTYIYLAFAESPFKFSNAR